MDIQERLFKLINEAASGLQGVRHLAMHKGDLKATSGNSNSDVKEYTPKELAEQLKNIGGFLMTGAEQIDKEEW